MPTTVRLTWADETALEVELSAESVEMAREIRHHGLRKALPMLYGMQIAWDSDAFTVA